MPRITIIILLLMLSALPAWAADPPRVLAGTSTVADILTDLCGDAVEVRELIPGGTCPGHYDLRPGDLLFLEQADLLVLEAYQPDLANMADLIRAADNTELQTFVLPLKYDTMLPQVQLDYTAALALDLADRFPDLADRVIQAAAQRIAMIQEVAASQADRLEPAAGVPALCAKMQAGFATWAGLEVVDTYGRPEDLSPEKYANLLEAGQARKVRLVLDNLQSGPGGGSGLAESLDAGQADLTSFPGGVPGQDDWASAFIGNVDRLIQALEDSGS